MPRDFLRETLVVIDHKAGVMVVDTTRRGVASQLRRAGFQETTPGDTRPYRRFQGAADQLRFRKPKGQRTTATGRRFVRNARRPAQNPAQDSTIAAQPIPR